MSASLVGGLNLAYWLYRIHPELFAALQAPANQAQQALRSRRKLGSLGDDGVSLLDTSSSFDPLPLDTTSTDTTPAFDTGSTPTFEIGSTPIDTSSLSSSDVSAAISSDLQSLPPPALQNVTIDAALTPPQVSIPGAVPSAAAATSSGGIGGALASVGGFLASATGLTSLTNLATAYYKANTPQAATVAAQVGRVQNGVNPAPITYAYNSAGQLVPVLAKPNTAGIALTPQTLANLIPSSWAPYMVPVGLGLLVLWALSKRG
jgi:hypothetical protein